MKAIFAHRNDAHGINGAGQQIVEIVDSRITVRLSTTGKKADFKLADVVAIDGTIEFGKSDADTLVESADATPAPEPQPQSAPLLYPEEEVKNYPSKGEAVEAAPEPKARK